MHFIDILFVKYPRIIFGRYLKIVTFYPILSIFVTLSVSIFLTIYGLYFNCTAIDFDPKKGFETRGTFLSKARLTLEELKTKQAKNENILRWYFGSKIKNRIKRSLNVSSRTTIEPITVNYDDYGVDSEPNIDDLNDNCAEFGTFGKSIPFDAIEYLTKIMIQISSYDQLFTVSTMKHLCQIDSIIEQTIQKTNFTNNLNLLKSSLNIPLYITCPNITIQNSCNSIDQYNVDTFRKLIEMCQKNQTLSICEAFSINQVINWLLTKPNKNGEILISAVLKVTMWNGKDEEFYKTLIENFKNHFDLMNSTKFVGISCNMKEYLFQQELFNDILYSGISG